MKIEISKKTDGTYLADCVDLHGSPPIGAGKTKNEALGNLVFRLSKEIEGLSGLTWLQKYFSFDIKFEEHSEPESHEEVHDDLWDGDINYVCPEYDDVGEI